MIVSLRADRALASSLFAGKAVCLRLVRFGAVVVGKLSMFT
jgi:hypothetical protein